MTVVSPVPKTASGGAAATWRACFEAWPAGIPQRGVLVTTFDEQIPFGSFMVADDLLFIERRNPDTLGTRSVILPFTSVAALKIVDPIESRHFRALGFQQVAAPKKEAAARAEDRPAENRPVGLSP